MSRATDAFTKHVNVSRETLLRLQKYEGLLRRWNPKINLVSPNTLDHAWTRHFLDSAQLLSLAPQRARVWMDLGSGGGFPGAVVAIMAAEAMPEMNVTLVEADQRKAAFLRAVSRETGVGFTVIPRRIEDVPPMNADVVSARALAPLRRLLAYAEPQLSSGGVALFPKGENVQSELDEALEAWTFDCEIHRSKAGTNSAILKIGEIERVRSKPP